MTLFSAIVKICAWRQQILKMEYVLLLDLYLAVIMAFNHIVVFKHLQLEEQS